MSLADPLKKAIDELIPAKWQTLVITPLLLMALASTATLVYANKRAETVKDAQALVEATAKVNALSLRIDLREAHDEDRDRRLRSIERAVREMQRDLAMALGNKTQAIDAQRRLNEMPPDDPR